MLCIRHAKAQVSRFTIRNPELGYLLFPAFLVPLWKLLDQQIYLLIDGRIIGRAAPNPAAGALSEL